MAPFRTPAGSPSPTARHPCHAGFNFAQSDQISGHGARSSRTSWGRRLSCSLRWTDGRCARARQVPPQSPRFPPSPSRTSPTCLTCLHCALSVRAGGFGPQASLALSHALWLGRVVRVPSARVRSESARILTLVAAHCGLDCLCPCVWRRGSLVMDAGAGQGVCGGLGMAKRPPERVHGLR